MVDGPLLTNTYFIKLYLRKYNVFVTKSYSEFKQTASKQIGLKLKLCIQVQYNVRLMSSRNS